MTDGHNVAPRRRRVIRYLVGGFRRAFPFTAVLLLLIPGMVYAFRPIYCQDPFWHIKAGEIMLRTHSVLRHDVFSHTAPGAKWVSLEWLSEIMMWGIYSAAGFSGIRLMSAVGFASIVVGCYVLFLKATRSVLWALVGVMIPFHFFLGRMTGRPEVLGTVLLVGFFLLLLRTRSTPIRRGTYVLWFGYFWIWTNLHGIAIFALWLFAIYVLAELVVFAASRRYPELNWVGMTKRQAWRLAGLLACAGIGSLLTPNHVFAHLYLIEHAFKNTVADIPIAEFQPGLNHFQQVVSGLVRFGPAHLPLGAYSGLYLVLIPILFAMGVPLLSRKGVAPRLGEIALSVACAYASWKIIRLRFLVIVPAAFVVAALARIPSSITHAGVPRRRDARFFAAIGFRWGFAALVTAIWVGGLGWPPPSLHQNIVADWHPQGISNFIEDLGMTGRIYNPYNWGGYLIWRLHPRHPVFVDGRDMMYYANAPDVMRDYKIVAEGAPGKSAILDKRGVDIYLSQNNRAPAFTGEDAAAWVLALRNREGLVCVRASAVEDMHRVQRFADQLGTELDLRGQQVNAAMISRSRDRAIRYNVVSEEFFRRLDGLRTASRSEQANVLARTAEECFEIGLYADALWLYELARSRSPYRRDVLLGMAQSYHALGHTETGLKSLRVLATIHPRSSKGWRLWEEYNRNPNEAERPLEPQLVDLYDTVGIAQEIDRVFREGTKGLMADTQCSSHVDGDPSAESP